MIRVLCPHCKKTVEAPESSAGRQVLCGGCGRPLSVPAAPDLSFVSPFGVASEEAESPLLRRRRERQTSGVGWWLAIITVLLGLIFVAVALPQYLAYREAREKEHLRKLDDLYEQMRLLQDHEAELRSLGAPAADLQDVQRRKAALQRRIDAWR